MFFVRRCFYNKDFVLAEFSLLRYQLLSWMFHNKWHKCKWIKGELLINMQMYMFVMAKIRMNNIQICRIKHFNIDIDCFPI